jgi:hypothetical protein
MLVVHYRQQVLLRRYLFGHPQLILRKVAHSQLKLQQARMTISATSFSGMWLHFHLALCYCQP